MSSRGNGFKVVGYILSFFAFPFYVTGVLCLEMFSVFAGLEPYAVLFLGIGAFLSFFGLILAIVGKKKFPSDLGTFVFVITLLNFIAVCVGTIVEIILTLGAIS